MSLQRVRTVISIFFFGIYNRKRHPGLTDIRKGFHQSRELLIRFTREGEERAKYRPRIFPSDQGAKFCGVLTQKLYD